MADVLDLNKLAPEPRKFLLGDKELEVHPPRLKTIVEIEKFFSELETLNPKESLLRASAIAEKLVPAMKEDDSIDFTPEQILALINFIYGMGSETTEKAGESKKKDG